MTSVDGNTVDRVGVNSQGEAYEPLTGRWSRLVAPQFLDWLDARRQATWLDVGCGTGALVQATIDSESPTEVVGVDPSSAYIAYARRAIHDPRVRYEVGSAAALPVASSQYDGVVSGLVLNVLSPEEQRSGVREMVRAARKGGRVGSYVWDYVAGMEPRVVFWQVAADLDESAAAFDERLRYPICHPDALARLWQHAGLNAVETISIAVEATFENFSDYWEPHLAGYGMAGRYVAGLTDRQRGDLEKALRAALPIASDRTITMTVKAWAVKGVK